MNLNPTILRIAIPAPLYGCFDYLLPKDCIRQDFPAGIRIKVPFGKREVIGLLIEVAHNTPIAAHQLKQAIAILDEEPVLSPTLLQLAVWASDYYHHPLGEVVFSMLPTLLRKGKAAVCASSNISFGIDLATTSSPLSLNPQQTIVMEQISQGLKQFQVFLLQGVTGSGKTEIYLQTIAKVLQEEKQALVLVPEIGLTPQTVERFRERFAVSIAVLHSNLTERERLAAWVSAKAGKIPIIIGTRSALFTPLLNPGLIIVDEEHDASFKQQEGFRYCARDLAIVRGRLENIPVLLGSATPSLESIYNAKEKRYQLLHLPARAGNAVEPRFHLIDLRNQKLDNGLSSQLLTAMHRHLSQEGQVLLFLNRRGFSPVLLCHACGWSITCKRCDVKLTYHQQPPSLLCHHCGATQSVPHICPACHTQTLSPLGFGTQRLEETLTKHFPAVGMVRIDRDSTRRKGQLQDMLATVHAGENRILLGTQMLAKGHHFPAVTLVGILNADNGIYSADFRAAEHVAQLLIQVAGRAGRAERAGEVIIQTHNPDHPLLVNLITQGYSSFVSIALTERVAAGLPPYTYQILVRAEAVHKNYPLNFLNTLKRLAEKFTEPSVSILGPAPAVIERRAGRYRAQLLFQSAQRKPLHQLLKKLREKIKDLPLAKRVRWSLDVDPYETV